MIQIEPQKLLDEKLSAEELFFYLRKNMEDPSADIYEDGYKKVIGFIACDIHGNIVSSFTTGKTPLKFNATRQAIIKHVQATTNKTKLAEDRYELAEAWKEKSRRLENSLQAMRVALMITCGLLLLLSFYYHKNLTKLRVATEKPEIIQYTDTLNNAEE